MLVHKLAKLKRSANYNQSNTVKELSWNLVILIFPYPNDITRYEHSRTHCLGDECLIVEHGR